MVGVEANALLLCCALQTIEDPFGSFTCRLSLGTRFSTSWISQMLRSFKVEMIVLSAIPSLVETWMAGFGFSLIDAEEKKLLDDINLMLFPGTVLLKKILFDTSFPEAGENNQFCSTQDESQILVGFDGKEHVETGQRSSEEGGLELDVEPVVSTYTNLEQQTHSLQNNQGCEAC